MVHSSVVNKVKPVCQKSCILQKKIKKTESDRIMGLLSPWFQRKNAGFEVISETIAGNEFMSESDAYIYNHIEKRASELMIKYPDKKKILENYLQIQREENACLENDIICSLLLLQAK